MSRYDPWRDPVANDATALTDEQQRVRERYLYPVPDDMPRRAWRLALYAVTIWAVLCFVGFVGHVFFGWDFS